MIILKDIVKSYDGKKNVVDHLDLHIEHGEIVVLIGESGCGKTTTMKMINRLIEPTSGSLLVDGKDIKEFSKTELRRNIGYVIQHVGLFPHLTIAENIATVPNLEKKDKEQTLIKVKELMELTDLPYDEYANRYPKELSGGQQQRIGVARALANDPDIILMDEPFSALDPLTREQLQNELLRLQDTLQKTIVFVTHDIDEALKLGDKIAVMCDGKILQYDTPEEILKNPKNEFIENFIGQDRLWKTPDMLRASDIMTKKITRVGRNRSVAHAIELMKEKNTNVLIVVEHVTDAPSNILGIVGANRLRGIDNHSIKMKDIMKTNINKVHKDTILVDVLNMRKEKKLHYTPVVDDNEKLIGIITNYSILNVLTDIVPESEEY